MPATSVTSSLPRTYAELREAVQPVLKDIDAAIDQARPMIEQLGVDDRGGVDFAADVSDLGLTQLVTPMRSLAEGVEATARQLPERDKEAAEFLAQVRKSLSSAERTIEGAAIVQDGDAFKNLLTISLDDAHAGIGRFENYQPARAVR